MNPREIQRIQQLAKLLRALKNQQTILEWLRENRELLRSMPVEDLELLREQTEYDREEWEKMVRELLT
jgi:hypothetical protein